MIFSSLPGHPHHPHPHHGITPDGKHPSSIWLGQREAPAFPPGLAPGPANPAAAAASTFNQPILNLSQHDWPTLSNTPQTSSSRHTTSPHPSLLLPSQSSTPPSEITSPSSAALDKFAPVYVPLWLRQIAAAAPARIIRQHSEPVQSGSDFAKAIFPKALYETIREETSRAERIVTSNLNLTLDPLEKLENSHIEPRYASKLLSLQIKEFQARKQDLASYNVVEIRAADTDDGGEGRATYNLFRLEAPEIREGYPMLEVNDVVFLRHLHYGTNGVSWNGIVYLAEVRAIKRAQALILIKCNALHGIIRDRAESFIVGFEPQGMVFSVYIRHASFVLLTCKLQDYLRL